MKTFLWAIALLLVSTLVRPGWSETRTWTFVLPAAHVHLYSGSVTMRPGGLDHEVALTAPVRIENDGTVFESQRPVVAIVVDGTLFLKASSDHGLTVRGERMTKKPDGECQVDGGVSIFASSDFRLSGCARARVSMRERRVEAH
jgi:hypothetical protein